MQHLRAALTSFSFVARNLLFTLMALFCLHNPGS
jgi:hypothetical protein